MQKVSNTETFEKERQVSSYFYAHAWSVLLMCEQYWYYYITNLFTLNLRNYRFGYVLYLCVKH